MHRIFTSALFKWDTIRGTSHSSSTVAHHLYSDKDQESCSIIRSCVLNLCYSCCHCIPCPCATWMPSTKVNKYSTLLLTMVVFLKNPTAKEAVCTGNHFWGRNGCCFFLLGMSLGLLSSHYIMLFMPMKNTASTAVHHCSSYSTLIYCGKPKKAPKGSRAPEGSSLTVPCFSVVLLKRH